MPTNASKESNFVSKYGGNFVSPAQFLSEMMCERQAFRENEELVNKFWTQPRWKREFKKQILGANALLKLYDIKVIIKVLMAKPSVFSLHAKWLDPFFQQEALLSQREKEHKEIKQDNPVATTKCGNNDRPTFKGKTSTLAALEGLENE